MRLARWVGRYGPNRHTDGHDGLWIDVTGVAHLFDGEEYLLADLMGRLSAFGVAAQGGLAGTLGAAHALARFGCRGAAWAMTSDAALKAVLAGLPVEALRLEPSSVLLLKRLGLRRIGQLYDIPRASLQRRFRSADAASAVLTRLDQAQGLIEEPRKPLAERPVLFVTRQFAEPLISSEAIENVTRDLCSDLAAHLEAKALGAKLVRLAIYRADGTAGEVRAAMTAPCRSGPHIMRLLVEKLANFDAGFGVDLVRLEALRAERDAGDQKSLATATAIPAADPSPLIDRLSNRFGRTAVKVLTPRASHIPERAEMYLPALDAFASGGSPRIAYAPPWPFPRGPRRPSFLLLHPEPIEVMAEVPDGPPVRFVWRRVERRVLRAEGPQRLEPEWWRGLNLPEPSKRRPRDYYRVEDQKSAAYWVFRHGLYGADGADDPAWFLHGLYA